MGNCDRSELSCFHAGLHFPRPICAELGGECGVRHHHSHMHPCNFHIGDCSDGDGRPFRFRYRGSCCYNECRRIGEHHVHCCQSHGGGGGEGRAGEGGV